MPRKFDVGLVTLAALTITAAAAAAAVVVLADPTVDRRANMGFMGMRGKKDDHGGGGGGGRFDDDDDETSAPAVGPDKRTLMYRRPLFGVDRATSSSSSSAEGFKRAMGFVGMRGKKEYYKGSAAAAGFFGMRGKKAAPSADAFFGVRGKKTAWPDVRDFRPPVADAAAAAAATAADADVERAVLVLHRIVDNLRTDQDQNFMAANFDEEREMR